MKSTHSNKKYAMSQPHTLLTTARWGYSRSFLYGRSWLYLNLIDITSLVPNNNATLLHITHYRAMRLQSFMDSARSRSLESVFLKGFQLFLFSLWEEDNVELMMEPLRPLLLMEVWRLELLMEPNLLLLVLPPLLLTPLLELAVEWVERSFRLLHCGVVRRS